MPLKIIGTSHISAESINEIKEEIVTNKPDIVAVELDLGRANALLSQKKSKLGLTEILHIGVKGYLFAKIAQYVQQKLGKMVGIAPGSEMKTALLLAKKNNLEIALIDQPIVITLKKLSKAITFKEKWRFFVDLVKSIFMPKKQLKDFGLDQFNLKKVPGKDVVKKMTNQMKKRYPGVHKALVDDRNRYMVKRLIKLMRKNKEKKILVIVGAGHVEGMEELFLKVDIVK